MRSVKLPCVCVGLLVAIVVTGCATPSSVEKVRTSLLSQLRQNAEAQKANLTAMEQRLKLQEERYKGLEQRIEQVAKIPRDLEAAVAAVNIMPEGLTVSEDGE